MANFEAAYQKVLQAEGGYQNNPNDSGNYNSLGALIGTNWGISAPVYEGWIGRPPTVYDMKNMPLSTAKSIYKTRFWDRIRGDEIRNQDVAEIVFDGAVNHGVSRGTKLLQKVLFINQDGVFGPVTLAAVNINNPATTYTRYKKARIDFYRKLAENPRQAVFLTGWLNRMEKFDAYSNSSSPIIGIALTALIVWGIVKYTGNAN